MSDESDACDALFAYTLSHNDPNFLHQHVVDGIAAQMADAHIKPIKLTFALAGLYLWIERHYTGREVQRVHMRMSQKTRDWPTFALPDGRGSMTAAGVMLAPEGPERDVAIEQWCASLWSAYGVHREAVIALLHKHQII